mgnify:CR=1 FL=1
MKWIKTYEELESGRGYQPTERRVDVFPNVNYDIWSDRELVSILNLLGDRNKRFKCGRGWNINKVSLLKYHSMSYYLHDYLLFVGCDNNSINITKYEDEWYYVEINDAEGYICDQISGLVNLLKDKFNL